jgi:hypothetical protein
MVFTLFEINFFSFKLKFDFGVIKDSLIFYNNDLLYLLFRKLSESLKFNNFLNIP